MENKKIIIIILVVVLITLAGFGIYKYMERRKAEKILNQVFDLQEQIITQGTENSQNIMNGIMNTYENIEASDQQQQMMETMQGMFQMMQ